MFFLCFCHQRKYIFISAHINLFHPFNDCLGNLFLLIGHLRLFQMFSVSNNATLFSTCLLHRCRYSCGIASQLLSQKIWLHFIQNNTTYCRMYFSILRKQLRGEIRDVGENCSYLSRIWLYCRSLCCRLNNGD